MSKQEWHKSKGKAEAHKQERHKSKQDVEIEEHESKSTGDPSS
jgi:hypothetical protein